MLSFIVVCISFLHFAPKQGRPELPVDEKDSRQLAEQEELLKEVDC